MIICVVGPTAVGKTALSIALAKKYNAIIINCDIAWSIVRAVSQMN